jgi:hypothetical protein
VSKSPIDQLPAISSEPSAFDTSFLAQVRGDERRDDQPLGDDHTIASG